MKRQGQEKQEEQEGRGQVQGQKVQDGRGRRTRNIYSPIPTQKIRNQRMKVFPQERQVLGIREIGTLVKTRELSEAKRQICEEEEEGRSKKWSNKEWEEDPEDWKDPASGKTPAVEAEKKEEALRDTSNWEGRNW